MSAAEAVDELQLVRGLQKRLVCVLAMDVDQAFAQFTNLRNGHRSGVDPGARTPFDINRATQNHDVGFVETCRGEPLFHTRRDIEFGADFGALCTFANESCVAAGTQNEFQRVDQNGLARTGFTGQTR